MHLIGAVRDLHTAHDGTSSVLGCATLDAEIDDSRTVTAISAPPDTDDITALIGQRGGGGFRRTLQAQLADDFAAGTPRYFLLDDIPAATLIGGFAWRLWPDAEEDVRRQRTATPTRDMANICSGFREDGLPTHLMRTGQDTNHALCPAKDLANPDDPLAWHEIQPPPGTFPMLRRRRRVDVRREGSELVIDAMFRDSLFGPHDEEMIVHEYQLAARADSASMCLTDVVATPRVLPYRECPAAAREAGALSGQPLAELRAKVLELLTGIESCTHLNDMLRAIAEVTSLAEALTS